jgi:hypothetical protein
MQKRLQKQQQQQLRQCQQLQQHEVEPSTGSSLISETQSDSLVTSEGHASSAAADSGREW